MVDIVFPVEAIDTSILGSNLEKWSSLLLEASKKARKPLDSAKFHRERLLEAGFEDVVQTMYDWPQGRWPRQKDHKIRGFWTQANLGDHICGLSMALLTRELEWSREEVEVFSALVRNDFYNREIHAVFKM